MWSEWYSGLARSDKDMFAMDSVSAGEVKCGD